MSAELPIPAGVAVVRDLIFGQGSGRPLRLHLALPAYVLRPRAAVIYIHGGGFYMGDKEWNLREAVLLAERGIVGATIEYRLIGEALYPAAIEDCKCAVRFLRAQAEVFNVDPERIGVWGMSAGGTLAALVGLSAGRRDLEGYGGWPEYSSAVQAVCDWCGPSEIPVKAGATEHEWLGSGTPEQMQRISAGMSSIHYVHKKAPPFLIVHGDADDIVKVEDSRRLHAALVEAGVQSTLHEVKSGPHGIGGKELDKMSVDFLATSLG